jgi:D-3-phosphoglycerate dehydrogenase
MLKPRWKILITAPYLQPVLDQFQQLFAEKGAELCVPAVNERLSEQELLSLIGDVDGIICGDDSYTETVLRSARCLKVLSKWGTGIDSINQDACQRLGIAVRNTPNAFSAPVADTVLGYILTFARNMLWTNEAMHAGRWEKLPGLALSETTLGIIGLGNIGQAVARRAIGFGMRILANDIANIPEEFLAATRTTLTSKETLLAESDFISLNCDLNPTSYHLISDPELALVKSTAVLINTARGAIVDEPAMVRALRAPHLGGAALDVFENEPLPLTSPLRAMPNVILAPHNANSSPTAYQRVHDNTIKQLFEVLENAAG